MVVSINALTSVKFLTLRSSGQPWPSRYGFSPPRQPNRCLKQQGSFRKKHLPVKRLKLAYLVSLR